ncbi:MAG: hypothetical protein ABJG86_12360 [Nitratireductor sp.]
MNDITRMKTQSQPARWTPWGEIPIAGQAGVTAENRQQAEHATVSLRKRLAWLERLARFQAKT